jgi:quinol monooxygenase YgiN
MGKVHVIARFVATEGRDNQLRTLLQGMLTNTRAESGCELYELMNSTSQTRKHGSISTKHGQVKWR